MNTNLPTRRCRGFTLVELLVVIGIIALLISILLPSLNRAREAANSVKCMSNLKQIGTALIMYASENKGFIVPGAALKVGETTGNPPETWATILVNGKYLKVPAISVSTTGDSMSDASSGNSVFKCPTGVDNRFGGADMSTNGLNATLTSFTSGTGLMFTRTFSQSTKVRIDTWYGINGWPSNTVDKNTDIANTTNSYGRYPFTAVPGNSSHVTMRLHKMSDFKDPSNLVLIYDGLSWHNQKPFTISARHNGKKTANAVFADGHCQGLNTPGDIPIDTDTPTTASTLKKYVPNGPRFMLTSQLTGFTN